MEENHSVFEITMKTPNLFYRGLCCFFAFYLALPAATVAQLLLTPPTFPTTNIVRVTLSGAASTNAYIILSTPELDTDPAGWQRSITGTVGQTTFDLSKTTNAAMFYIASDAPNLTPTVATPIFSPAGGSYALPTNVTITCATDGAAIYYTTNGSTPTTLDNYIYNGGSVYLASIVTLKAKAFKSGYNESAVTTATYTINSGPSVTAGAQQVLATTSTTLTGFVSDDGLMGGGTRFTNWSKVTGPGTVTFGNASLTNSTASFSADGIYVLQLRASDGQYTNSSQVTIAVNPTLSVSITAPTTGAEFTVPTNILVQATAACTSGSVTQLLFYSGSSVIGVASNLVSGGFSYEWRSLPEGTHSLTAVAKTDDPNNFSLASDPVAITVNWPTNVGQVAFALTDVQIPVAGFPVSVSRVYDTRYGSSSSFGNNGKIDWEIPKIEAGSLTEGWEGFTSIQYCVRESSAHLVTISLSESEKYYFTPRVLFNSTSQQCINAMNPLGYYDIFVNVVFDAAGGQGALTVNSPGNLGLTPTGYDPGDGCLGTWLGPLKLATFEPDDFEICSAYATDWQPSPADFTFTAPDGTQYTFAADGTLASKTDRNGNSVSYGYGGISHSTGKQVTFTRDGNNRITEIYDPIAINTSGSPALKYDYDDIGNLTNVARLIQRSPATYENTAYAYTNTSFPSHLTSIKDARGIVSARYEYDSSGRLSKQYDALNRFTSYTYDLINHRQIVTDRMTNSTIQTFTESGQVASVQDPNNGVTSYTYDERGRKASETNPQGKTTYFTYDADDNLTGQTNEVGASTSETFDDFGQVLVSIDARGFGTTNAYDASGNLTFTTNALGVINAYGYDVQGNRTHETNALGRAEQVILISEYNSFGYLTSNATFNASLTLLAGVGYTYDDNGNRVTETRPRTLPAGGTESILTQFNFDAANRVIETVNALNLTNRVVYDPLGKQSQTIDALNRTNRYFYDALGLLTNTTYADGLSEKSFYDAEGRRTQSVNRGGRTNIYAFDALGRLNRTTFPDGSYVFNAFDSAGRLYRTGQGSVPSGGIIPVSGELVTRFYFDAAGRQTAVTNALNQGTRYAYDASGNQTNIIDALNRTNTYAYDVLNRLTKVTYPDTTTETYGYDGLDRKIAVTNQANIVTRFGFDALGRLIAVTNAFGTTSAQITKYEYDEVGNLLRQIDGLNRTNRFEYDALGRRTKETMPGTQVQTFGYDAVGNLTRLTNFNAVVITNAYDVLNRLTNKASVSGYKITYAYSATNLRTNMTDASGTNSYAYDSRDRLLTNTTPQGTLVYTYDGFGNLATTKSLTASGVSVAYTYDVLNRLTNATDLATSTTNTYDFDAVGNLQTMRYHSGVTNRYSYDALNRLTNLVAGTPSASLASFAYRLAPAGNRTNLIHTVNAVTRTNQWQYDPLYRLTNEVVSGSAPTGSVGYRYDGVGNRTNRTSTVSGITNQAPAYNSNDQVTADAYDSNGNTRTNSGNAFFYDAENRLTNAVVSGASITIIYDGDGNRVRKIVGTTTNTFLVDSQNPSGYAQVLEEKTGATLTRVYTYGLDLIAQRDLGANLLSYFGYDGNGNTRYLTGTNAAISDTYFYDAFGTTLTNTGTTTNFYRFTGEQFDSSMGFYYLRARYQNPNSGRFTSRDTYPGRRDEPASLHRYNYAHNNPVDNTDPSGKEIVATLTVLSIAGNLGGINFAPPVSSVAQIAGGIVRKSRALTAGEITLATSIFGGKVDYTKVKIFNRPWIAQDLFTAVTPNGNIYVRGDGTKSGGLYRSDYSADPDVDIKGLFIHEMTHVWQFQIGQLVKTGATLNRNYDYEHAKLGTQDLKKYGIEQQAHIVEDMFLIRSGAPIYDNGYTMIVQNPPSLQTYQKVTSPHFP